MRDRDLRDKLTKTLEHLATLEQLDLATLDPRGRVLERSGRKDPLIREALLEAYRTCSAYVGRGYPTDRRAQPQGRSGGHGGSSTERAATRRDQFLADRRQADAHLANMLRSARWLASFTVRYLAPAADTGAGLREDCASCARAGVFVDPVRTPQSFEGVPSKPLCAWCYRFVLSEGCWPPLLILEAHLGGRRITVQMVEEALGR